MTTLVVSNYVRAASRRARDAAELTYLTTFFYSDGTRESVAVRAPAAWTNAQVYAKSSDRRKYRTKSIKHADGPHEQLEMFK